MFFRNIFFYQYFLLVLSFFVGTAFAEGFTPIPRVAPAISQEKCFHEGETFGDKNYRPLETLFKISQDCIDLVLFHASQNKDLNTISKDGLTKLFAYKNFIILEELKGDKRVQKVISGAMSKLSNVVSIIMSDDKKYLSVLNQSAEMNSNSHGEKEILTFSFSVFGNVSPVKINRSSVLKDINFISYSEDNSKFLLAVSGNESFIASYDIKSDSRSPMVSKKPRLEKVLSGKNLRSPASLAEYDGVILILDKEEGVKAFSPSESDMLWGLNLKEIGLKGRLEKISVLHNNEGSLLKVVDNLNKEAFFSLDK